MIVRTGAEADTTSLVLRTIVSNRPEAAVRTFVHFIVFLFMKIGSENNSIEIIEMERAPKGVPNEGDVRVLVQVVLGEFSGKYESVWLEEPALREFISRFEEVERERAGNVTLESCSPDEFVLKVRSRDALGHFAVDVSLCRHRYFNGASWPTSVSGGFEIDPTSLPAILNDFKNLHTPSV